MMTYLDFSCPDFSYEKKLWQKGLKIVVGVDEVGRGAWAGPVVVSAVVWPWPGKLEKEKLKMIEEMGINDSKLLKSRERERLAKEIKERALAWDITEVGVGVINRIGIGKATAKAMRKTISDLIKKGFSPDFILVDFYSISYLRGLGQKDFLKEPIFPGLRGRQLGIKQGDKKSISIAAASILAKVYRDAVMRRLSKKYPQYGWGKNKGYGTKIHQKAIIRYGMTRFHRKAFVETWRKTLSKVVTSNS